MKPNTTLHSVVYSITTAIIYFLWGNLKDIISKHPGLGFVLGLLIALGTYKAVFKSINWFFTSKKSIKKLIFGKYYLEGIWLGCYLDSQSNPVYFIEYYEQDFENFVIRGKAFSNSFIFIGSWVSDSVSLDIEKGKLIYSYNCDMVNRPSSHSGHAIFYLEREYGGTPAHKLFGYTSDLHRTKKARSIEEKYIGKEDKNDLELLKQAKKVYETNKHYFK